MNRRVFTLLSAAVATLACAGEPRRDTPASTSPATAPPATTSPATSSSQRPPEVHTTAEAAARDASTDLTRVPLSAADYRLYANIMGGAGALGLSLTDEDRALLEWLRKVDAGTVKAGAADQSKLARARALQNKDDELARMQGIDGRYQEVKARIESLIGPRAKPPAGDDGLARENLRFLEAYRAEIQRLQGRVRDPLSRERQPTP